MNIIMLAVVVSVVFLGITGAIALSRWGAGGVAVFSLGSSVVSLKLDSEALVIQSLLTLVLALVCTAFRLKPTAMVLACVAAASAGFGIVGLIGYSAHRRVQAMRSAFPFESVADRLAYEDKATSEVSTIISMPSTLSGQVEQRLYRFENRESLNFRQNALMILHEQQRNEFEMAMGFGSSRLPRMVHWLKQHIELPDSEPISVPSKPEPSSDPGSPVHMAAGLASIHWYGQEDFLEPKRFGYVKDRDHVAGFEPHRFSKLPALPSWNQTKANFQLVRLELVSLLKHETPVVYVSEHLPQMDELKDAPTRPLNDFERHALDRLRSEEDLVIDDAPNRIRMVGSLRAGKDCMECHSVRRGELLGAFSYELIGGRPVKERVEPGA